MFCILKEFDNISEIANYFNLKFCDVLETYEKQFWRGSFFVDENQIKIETLNDQIKYVCVDENSNKDCKEYLMKYDIKKYDWKVYDDNLEQWQNCNVVNIENDKLDIVRATVETESGAKIDRDVDYAMDKDDLVANGCVFMVEKEYEIEKINTKNESLDSLINAAEQEKKSGRKEIKNRELKREMKVDKKLLEIFMCEDLGPFDIKDSILLAVDNRGGYFLKPDNSVVNVVFKNSGYGNCIFGDLDYMKNLIKWNDVNGRASDYRYTKEGKNILGIVDKKSLDDILIEAFAVCKEDNKIDNKIDNKMIKNNKER